MNTIKEELKLSRKYMIEDFRYKGKLVAKLTQENVAKVEAMIRNDSDYMSASDIKAAPTNKFGGSQAYWMIQIKSLLSARKSDDGYTYDEAIRGAVEAVDRTNSTHLNSDGCGRDEITERICRFSRKELVACLKDPDYKNMKLFRIISERTSATKRARENPSFASKFCHYACFYIFEGTMYQDNYSIYDRIVRESIPLYLDYYGIDLDDYDLFDYADYQIAIDEIREASGIKISRNGFDHLLWYYYKGRI